MKQATGWIYAYTICTEPSVQPKNSRKYSMLANIHSSKLKKEKKLKHQIIQIQFAPMLWTIFLSSLLLEQTNQTNQVQQEAYLYPMHSCWVSPHVHVSCIKITFKYIIFTIIFTITKPANFLFAIQIILTYLCIFSFAVSWIITKKANSFNSG